MLAHWVQTMGRPFPVPSALGNQKQAWGGREQEGFLEEAVSELDL